MSIDKKIEKGTQTENGDENYKNKNHKINKNGKKVACSPPKLCNIYA